MEKYCFVISLLVLVLFKQQSVSGEGVFISYRGRNYSNYALFGHSGIALQTPLLCKTDLDSCCTSVDNPNGGGQGMWYYPSGVQVPAGGVAKAGQIYGRTRSSQAVRLHRTAPGIPAANGIYRCAVSDRNHVLQKRYVGLYTHGTGQILVSQATQFFLVSVEPLEFTLTITTTGGPPSIAHWLLPSSTTAESSSTVQGESVLRNGRTSTVRHSLTVTERTPGEYRFSTGNSRTNGGSLISRSITIEGASPPTGFMAVQSGITSIQACWNAPRGNSSANHTGFRIFYKPIGSGEDDEQSLVVAANVTCRTITGLQSEMTYTVSMVALGRQLPSAVVGPVIVPLELFNLTTQVLGPTSIRVAFPEPKIHQTTDRYDIIVSRVHGASQTLCPAFNHTAYYYGVHSPYTLRNLQEFSSYIITVTTNMFTVSAQAFTSFAAPTEAPEAVTSISVLSTAITIAWTPVACIDRNGVTMSYLVIYGPENGTKIESTVASRGIDISGVFTARGLTPLTSYSFEVAAVNSAGTGPFTAPLVVGTDVPIIVPTGSSQQNVTLKRRVHFMRATLSFEASVSPLENITWTFTNQSHELIDIFSLSSSRYVLSSNHLSLTILKLSALDSGIYTIAVHTTRNEAATSSITLEIYAEPLIVRIPRSSIIATKNETQTVSFSCRADGIPQPTITWYHNNQLLLPSFLPKVSATVNHIPGWRPGVPQGVEGVLTVADLRLSDAGVYRCKSYGAGSHDFISYLLNVIERSQTRVVFSKLNELLSKYSRIDSLEVVENVTAALEDLASDVVELQIRNLVETYLSVVDNVLQADLELLQESQSISNTSGRVLNALEMVAESIPLVGNETTATIAKRMFAVVVQEVESEFAEQTFSAVLGSGFTFQQNQSINSSQLVLEDNPLLDATAAITLPDSSDLNNIDLPANYSSSATRVTFSVFLTNSLFVRRDQRNSSRQLGSVIITASLSSKDSGEITVENLATNISIFFVKNPELANASNPLCSFWDPNADSGYGNWSQEGCHLVNETADTVHCVCNHLTNFAILLDVSPGEPGPPAVEKTLESITFIGISISILCLLLTLITYFGTRKLRSSEAGKLVIHLSCAFLGVYLSFILSFFAPKVEELCVAAGALVHYFLLVTFFVMAAEAIHLYIHLVLVIGFHIHHYVLKSMLVAWIFPAIIVVASVAPDYYNYINPNFCRPYGFPFWGGLFAPFLIIYIFNWTVFLIIIISIIHKKRKRNDELEDNAQRSEFKKHFIIAITLSLLLGLGWGFGIPATQGIQNIAVRTIFQALFIVLTSFQGLFIFAMQCLRSKAARNEWRRWFCLKSGQNELSNTFSFTPKFNRSFQSGSMSSYKKGSQRERSSFKKSSLQRDRKNINSPQQAEAKGFRDKTRKLSMTNEASFIYYVRKQHRMEMDTSSSSVPAYELSTLRRKSEESNLSSSM